MAGALPLGQIPIQILELSKFSRNYINKESTLKDMMEFILIFVFLKLA
jgi:hypothetical protein